MADNFRINSADDPCYQYRNIIGVPSRKRIIYGIAFIFLILTLVVIAFIIMSNQCCTAKVKKLEPYAEFQNKYNTSVDPCVNFYDFTCGVWSQKIDVSPDKPRVTNFGILQEAINRKKKIIFENTDVDQDLPNVVNYALKFYNLCVSENRNTDVEYKTLVDTLNQFGGWPLLNQSWNEDLFNWTQASIFISRNFGVNIVITAYLVDKDGNDDTNNFYIMSPNLFTDSNEPLSTNPNILYAVLQEMNVSGLASVGNDLINLESKWIELFYNDSGNQSAFTISLRNLMEEIPEVDWLNYLHLLMNDFLHAQNKSISLNDIIHIRDMDYLKKLVRVLSSDTFSKLELANLFGWFAVRDMAMIIPGILKRYGFMNHYDLAIIKIVAKRKCYDLVSDLFECAFDYLYIKNSSIAGLQDSKIMITYVELAFNDIIQDSNWLDKVTKNTLLHKLHALKNIIGFKAYLNNKTEFDISYKDFPIFSDNLLGYYFQLNRYYGSVKSSKLPRSVTDVSAYYILNKNTFVFPISLLNAPFYYLNGPSYLNFGATGSIVAHEIMHGFGTFDDDSKYLLSNLFSNVSSILFQKRAECFKNQYERYDESGKLKNNGTLTLRENIADSEGLRIAFEAYKKHKRDYGLKNQYVPSSDYSPDQMFFISFGTFLCSKMDPAFSFVDTHSSSDLRVNGAVSNSESFASVFNCPIGSPMNPVKKCLVW